MKGSFWEPSRTMPSGCDGCPRKAKARGFVPGFGEIENPRMIILMEQPGENELIEGKPAVGKTGYHTDKALGGYRYGVFVTNVRKCLAPKESSEVRRASIAHCIAAYLQPEFDKLAPTQPKGLLLMGADAVQAVMARGNMAKLHASQWTLEEVQAMVRASTQPAATLISGDETDEPS